MSNAVKLSTKLPGQIEVQGLDAIVDELLNSPSELRCAFVVYDVPRALDNFREDTRVPVVEVRQWEPLGLVGDVPAQIKQAILESREKRTGRTPLPLDVLGVDEPLVND